MRKSKHFHLWNFLVWLMTLENEDQTSQCNKFIWFKLRIKTCRYQYVHSWGETPPSQLASHFSLTRGLTIFCIIDWLFQVINNWGVENLTVELWLAKIFKTCESWDLSHMDVKRAFSKRWFQSLLSGLPSTLQEFIWLHCSFGHTLPRMRIEVVVLSETIYHLSWNKYFFE